MCMLLDCFCLVTVACACKPFFSESFEEMGAKVKVWCTLKTINSLEKFVTQTVYFLWGEGALRYILVSVSRLGLKLNLVK